jgi:hypothetical protein
MAGKKDFLKPSDRRFIAQRGPGQLGVEPPQQPSIFGCPELASKDVIEGVQV